MGNDSKNYIRVDEKLKIIEKYIEMNGYSIKTNTEFEGYKIGKWLIEMKSKSNAGKVNYNEEQIQKILDYSKSMKRTIEKVAEEKIQNEEIKIEAPKKGIKPEEVSDEILDEILKKIEIDTAKLQEQNQIKKEILKQIKEKLALLYVSQNNAKELEETVQKMREIYKNYKLTKTKK